MRHRIDHWGYDPDDGYYFECACGLRRGGYDDIDAMYAAKDEHSRLSHPRPPTTPGAVWDR